MKNECRHKILMWALTYKCNLSCQYCFLSNPESAYSTSLPELSIEDTFRIAEKICGSSEWKPDAVWLTGGEPTLRSELYKLIDMFNASQIYPVITTNGKFSTEYASFITSSKPRAISISLDSEDIKLNDELRGDTSLVVNNIKNIAKMKHNKTILGISVVIDDYNIGNLSDFARYLADIGVEYLSINLRYNQQLCGNVNNINIAKHLRCQIEKIENENQLNLPSKQYLDLLISFCCNHTLLMECPASKNYFFISPWGWAYPCSAEFWHTDHRFLTGISLLQNELNSAIESLQLSVGNCTFTTRSSCFGTRCLGCWKIYYDNIIFGDVNYV